MRISRDIKLTDIKTLFMAFLTSCIYIVSTPVLARGEDSVHESCSMSAVCLTVTIKYTAPDLDWTIDDIKLKLDAAQCQIEVGDFGATKIIDGYVDYSVSKGVTDFSRSWRVPKGCPYLAHSRFNNKWGSNTERDDSIDAAQTGDDYCFKINFYTRKRTSC